MHGFLFCRSAAAPQVLQVADRSRRRDGNPILVPVLLAALFASAPLANAEPSIRVLKGANQQTVYGSRFDAPLVVWVTDRETQQPLPDVRVHFAADAGIGLSAASAVTDQRGLAAVSATGLAACTSTVSAEIEGFPASRAGFGRLIVQKATLTVVPSDAIGKVGAEIPEIAGYTIRGFVNGDTEETAQISGSPVLTTTATQRSPHGNYAIKGGVGTLAAPNYAFEAGFGTLAILDGPDSGIQQSVSREAQVNLASLEAPTDVRPALAKAPVAVALREPAFLAGLRGESGVFVQTAILQSFARTRFLPTTDVRADILPKPPAPETPTLSAPVRPAVAAKLLDASATLTSSATVRTGVLTAVFAAPAARTGVLPVRTAALPDVHAVAVSNASPYSASAIRKALIPPGTK